ncbi:Gfo/Idh/MocA family oxidoreductase [Roseivirga seohaensis]|uniref:Gfo/Idh/MocA family oxidoreductase n=1 Tax=Roseivirga seohaensis TaxID=1914963 RepID=UPI003BAC91CD
MADVTKKLRLGVIGMSDGNGHPYSWSAIFNGYNLQSMKDCGFPVIPEYLNQQIYPNDFLCELGTVTHVWTQDIDTSRHIALTTHIPNVCEAIEDMIGKVDAVLLARDDAQNHVSMAMPFIMAGLPIFIDKPLALNRDDAKKMFSMQKFESQIFTCSSLRFAQELMLSKEEKMFLGKIKLVEGSVMKYWDTYAIHLLEPLIVNIPNRGKLQHIRSIRHDGIHLALIEWKNLVCNLKVTGGLQVPLQLCFFGENGQITKKFEDSFSCFRSSLKAFIEQIESNKLSIQRDETLELMEILEKGKG